MEMMLRLCLLIVSMTGYILFFTQKYRIRIEFAPALFCAWTSNLLFAAGIWNILPQMVWLLYAGGFLLLALSWKYNFRFDRRSLLLYGSFLCLAAFFFQVLKRAHFTGYDNFSHWATVVKDMLLENRMPNFEDPVIRFQSYPLGSSLFLYGICRMIGTAEGCMLWAQLLMQISFLFCTMVLARKKNWYLLPVLILFGMWALSVNNSIYELRVDTLLPLAGIAAFTVIFHHKKEPEKALSHSVGILMLLINIKNSGVFFYAACILFFVACTGKYFRQHKLRVCCAGLAAPLLMMYLWKRHVAFAFSDGMASKHSMDLAHFGEMAAKKTKDDMIGIGLDILRRFTELEHIEVKLMLLLTVFLLVMAVLLYPYGQMKKMFRLLAADWGCLAAYTVSLYAMYVFSMPMGESARLASYDRYVLSVLIFLYGVTAVVVLDTVGIAVRELTGADIARLQMPENARTPVTCIFGKIQILPAAVLILFAAALAWQVRERLQLLYQQPAFAGTKRSHLQELIRKDGIKEGDSCVIYCHASDDDARYLFYLARYELWSDEILVVQEKDFEEHMSEMEDYGHLIVWDSDVKIDQYLKNHGIGQ